MIHQEFYFNQGMLFVYMFHQHSKHAVAEDFLPSPGNQIRSRRMKQQKLWEQQLFLYPSSLEVKKAKGCDTQDDTWRYYGIILR